MSGKPTPSFRTLDDRFAPPHFTSAAQWSQRAAYVREHVLASAGLLPMPDRTPLKPVIFDEIVHEDYAVAKVYFESLPGFFVTGNLYRPARGTGPFPAVLSAHGHWTYGRVENTPLVSGPGRAINLARQGYVVFTHDMIGYNDSRQLPHTFGGRAEHLWGLSLAGLQLWNSIRSLDFLESLPFVQRDAIGATGESGGGTQTFLLAAVDDRVAAAVPVNMISLHMQGGCLCENPPGLRLDTTNVEIAATIAPRPLLMVSATGDWTNETLELEYPAVRAIYSLLGADERVRAVRFTAEHNYDKDSREAMYDWMGRWLQHASAEESRAEIAFTPDPLGDLLVFHHRPLPPDALTAAQVTANWIAAARRQLATTPLAVRVAALEHALSLSHDASSPDAAVSPSESQDGARRRRTRRGTRLARGRVHRADRGVHPVRCLRRGRRSSFRNLQPDARRTARRGHRRGCARLPRGHARGRWRCRGRGRAGCGGRAASPGDPRRRSIREQRATSDFLDRLYLPGIRRAGDVQTAIEAAPAGVIIHNADDRFSVTGGRVIHKKLTPAEIVALVKSPPPLPKPSARP